MKLVLLTGATGFVGRKILNDLIKKKYRVRVVVRKGSEKFIKDNFKVDSIVLTPDIFSENENWWEDTCCDVDIIIHAAWYAKSGKYLQSMKNIDCLVGTISMAKGAIKSGVKRFVGIGTCFEYDVKFGFLTVDTPLHPETIYAVSKASTFNILTHLFSKHKVEFLWCRLFFLYGEGEDDLRLYSYLHKQLSSGNEANLTSGNQVRDYMDVAEVSRDIVNLSLGVCQGPANICSGVPITVKQFAEKIAYQYNGMNLLKFNSRPENLTDPICVVGVKNNNINC